MPKQTLVSEDYIKALTELGYSFRLNKCNDYIELDGSPLTDVQTAVLRTQMRDAGFTAMGVMEDAYITQAYKNAYHPIKDYLWSLRYDEEDHISAVAECITDKYGIFALWFKKWLIGAVAKVCEDGEPNPMFVIDGAQDIGKSTFVRWLAGGVDEKYFIEAPINLEDKDDLVRLASIWIWEAAELGSTVRRTDRESLKHFLTRRSVTVRKPYGHGDIHKPAMASFIGTVNNESGILSDPTGNRRFLICNVTHIDYAYSEMDVNQLWAQAMTLYQAGESARLTEDEKALSKEINDEYEIDNPIQGLVEKYMEFNLVNEDWWTSTTDILEHLVSKGLKESSRATAMGLAAAMTRLGVKKAKRTTDNNRRVWGYVGVRPTR